MSKPLMSSYIEPSPKLQFYSDLISELILNQMKSLHDRLIICVLEKLQNAYQNNGKAVINPND